MRNYRQLKKEYEELDERYNRLYGEKAELEYEFSVWKESAQEVQEQDMEIRALHDKMRRLKHDLKNHLMVISSYLNDEDYAEAKSYTSQILDKLNSVHSYIETGNSLLNHILNEKLEKARLRGVLVKAEVENLSFSKMESIDFSALLSNILDNAVEACEKEKDPQLFVRLVRRREYDTIFVKNKISHSVLESNPELYSTKPEKSFHGIGIEQIKGIIKKYDGMCDFYEEDGFFCVSVFIPV